MHWRDALCRVRKGFASASIVNFVIDYFATPRIICANHGCWNVSGKPYGMLVIITV
jgi:hypothetical protein